MFHRAMLASILVCCGTALAATPSSWTMWVEGDPPNWTALEKWVTGGEDAKLPTGNLVIRLIDPTAPNGDGYVLPSDPSAPLPASLAFIKDIRASSYDGQISMVPYYGDGLWNWTGGGDLNPPQWSLPIHWVMQANQALAAHGVSNGIYAVNYENFDTHNLIEINDINLRSWQTYLMGLWPTWNKDPAFVGLMVSKDNKSATNILRWTTTKTGPGNVNPPYPQGYYDHVPLVGGMLECYETYKHCGSNSEGGYNYVVDATKGPPPPPSPPDPPSSWYPSFSGPQIYEAAGHSSDPAAQLLGVPTLTCPNQDASPPEPSTMGFLIACNAPMCEGGLEPPLCMTGADLSKITFLFSNGKSGESAKIFGIWDGIATPATVETFIEFVGNFDGAFSTYWASDASKMPQYGIWHFNKLPPSWMGSAPSCPGDLSGDSIVNIVDLLQVIEHFGLPGGDVNADGVSDILDLLHILDHYGRTCH